jgi:iron complex outermembrane receptor protein
MTPAASAAGQLKSTKPGCIGGADRPDRELGRGGEMFNGKTRKDARRPVSSGMTVAGAVAVALLAAPSSASAQEAREAGPRMLEEIVVTAQKREQRLQDVPVSISALTSELLQDSGVVGVQDLAQLAPGLIIAETIGRQTTVASIRGVAPFGFADETVVMMIDGYTSGFQRSGNNATLLDLERVEILRGPQATLYGRNAIGGVINYITRRPDNEFRGSLRADAGTRGNYLVQGSVSGPIMRDVLYGGIALGYRESGGFMDNDATGEKNVNDQEDLNARATLRFTPTEALEANLTVDYNEADDAAGDPSYAYQDRWFGVTPPTLVQVGAGAVDFNRFERRIAQRDTGGFEREESTIVLNVAYQFSGATLTSITGTSNQETSVSFPFNRLPSAPFLADVQWDVESWSQELRLTSRGDGPLQWLLGAYYFDNSRDRQLFLVTGAGSSRAQWTTDDVTNQSLFANVDYAFTDRVSLKVGLRYDDEERELTDRVRNRSGKSDAQEWLPSISLSYRPSRDLHLYGTISRGYHAGGPNELGSVAAGAPPTYEPEYLTNYEIGAKGSMPDAAFSYEVAVFYMDWEDQQIFTAFDLFNRYIINAGQSEIMGLEVSGTWLPTEHLTLTASFSYLDAEYKEFFAPLDAAPFGLDPDLSGNNLVYSSEFSGTLSAQYVAPIGTGGWSTRLRADLSYVGERPFDTLGLFIADAYTLVDLYAGVQNERYEVGLFANNAFDEDFLTGGFLPSAGGFPPLATVGKPSQFGVRAKVSF